MNDLLKNKIHRLLRRLGLRVSRERHYRFFTSAGNYAEILGDIHLDPSYCPVIFDVGANIGQTSLWYAGEFPDCSVYAFEPVSQTFALLESNTRGMKTSIQCFGLALGDACGQQKITLGSTDPCCQTNSLARAPAADPLLEQTIEVTTLDSFCAERGVERIDILKTDTEGYDLHVLKGAAETLGAGRVRNVVSEASFQPGDTQHTQLSALTAFLEGHGFQLHSLYDLSHSSSGKLKYFNAHFKLK